MGSSSPNSKKKIFELPPPSDDWKKTYPHCWCRAWKDRVTFFVTSNILGYPCWLFKGVDSTINTYTSTLLKMDGSLGAIHSNPLGFFHTTHWRVQVLIEDNKSYLAISLHLNFHYLPASRSCFFSDCTCCGCKSSSSCRSMLISVVKKKCQWIILVLVKGGRDDVWPLEGNIYLVCKRYILPIGWLYTAYHSSQEPAKFHWIWENNMCDFMTVFCGQYGWNS